MASALFKDLYDAVSSGEEASFERQVVPAGTYDVVVDSARPYTGGKSPMIFLTLAIASGPLAGKKSDVNVTFSESPNARVYFARKTKGLFAYPDALAAFQAAQGMDDESGLAAIASSWLGKALKAEIGVQSSGPYAGGNELKSTEAGTTGSAPAVAAPAPAVAAPAASPQSVTVPASAGAPAPAPAPATETGASLPFSGGAEVPF